MYIWNRLMPRQYSTSVFVLHFLTHWLDVLELLDNMCPKLRRGWRARCIRLPGHVLHHCLEFDREVTVS